MWYTGKRRCGGSRKAGGVYNSIDISPYGQPLDYYIFCPPQKIVASDLGLSSQGVRILEINNVSHVIDVVGTAYYPYVPDFVEEGMAVGFSRRFDGSGINWSLLSEDSRHLLAHPRAIITNHEELRQDMLHMPVRWSPTGYCPKNIAEHYQSSNYSDSPCLSMTWQSMQPTKQELPSLTNRTFWRSSSVGFRFAAAVPPHNCTIEFELGIFMWLPITLEIVYDPVGNRHEKAIEQLKKSGTSVQWKLVDDREGVKTYDTN